MVGNYAWTTPPLKKSTNSCDIHTEQATPHACECCNLFTSKHALPRYSTLDLEPTSSCSIAELRKQKLSHQNGVNDLRTWVAQQMDEYEALLLTSSTGELEVNPVFFTPPSKTNQRLAATSRRNPAAHDASSNASSDRHRPTSHTSSSTPALKSLQHGDDPRPHKPQEPGRSMNLPPQAISNIPTLFRKPIDWDEEALLLEEQDMASDYPTLFRKPIDWHEEALLLEEQDTASNSALPELARSARSCSESEPIQPQTPETGFDAIEQPSTDWPPADENESANEIKHDPPHDHSNQAAEQKQESRPYAATTSILNPLQLQLDATQQRTPVGLDTSTTAQAGPSRHLSPAKRPRPLTFSYSGPAKKARPTVETFTENMVSEPLTRPQPASEVLRQLAGAVAGRYELRQQQEGEDEEE